MGLPHDAGVAAYHVRRVTKMNSPPVVRMRLRSSHPDAWMRSNVRITSTAAKSITPIMRRLVSMPTLTPHNANAQSVSFLNAR